MKLSGPRLAAVLSAVAIVLAAGALLSRRSCPRDDFRDLRDSLNDFGSGPALSSGHASLAGRSANGCTVCHISRHRSSQRPLWTTEASAVAHSFGDDSAKSESSGLCLSCHDGVVASSLKAHSNFGTAARDPFAAPDMSASHPVGVDYYAAMRGKPADYNDPALESKIVLDQGRVGCVSCHSTHGAGTFSASNVRDEACLACHRR